MILDRWGFKRPDLRSVKELQFIMWKSPQFRCMSWHADIVLYLETNTFNAVQQEEILSLISIKKINFAVES